MEIFAAIESCGNPGLQARFKKAMSHIERTIELYGCDALAFSFNGGKDSTVLLHLLRAGYAAADSSSHTLLKGQASNGPAVTQEHPIRTIYFENPETFPEIHSFTVDCAQRYHLALETIRLDFLSGLKKVLAERPIKAIFLGTRAGDPNARGQEVFAPSSKGWPAFMRVNPILDWSYHDVWDFLLACQVSYCSLYDVGYTSIGNIHDTIPNPALRIEEDETTPEASGTGQPNGNGLTESVGTDGYRYRPANELRDGRLERSGRFKKKVTSAEGKAGGADVSASERRGEVSTSGQEKGAIMVASVIVVGDELLRGDVSDFRAPLLSKRLRAAGWLLRRVVVVPDDIDAVFAEVQQHARDSDLVLVSGGVGPALCDVTLDGVAKAFDVRLTSDAELLAELQRIHGTDNTPTFLKLAEVPEGITELLPTSGDAFPLLKVKNVVVVSGRSPVLEAQLAALEELSRGRRDLLKPLKPFVTRTAEIEATDREAAAAMLRTMRDFPGLQIGYFHTDSHPTDTKDRFTLTIDGKSSAEVSAALQTFSDALDDARRQGSKPSEGAVQR
ncbi:phosphoadenosine phosphosulfate (PAPS) reductase family protein [Klebsormidium nitens]|uniref:FAD synthase n=1 Tax=Klebsormidium nitens TaxID=105231 RepID=A0A0U9HM95_KLENI|nr:phosphoadenosine phosphosulfate (PAPS) reductase family protein [Klebsormidium nitens]|eukprot:GAQ79445.1 phosphoadenosine phosphosulfate (PAPS) reductase family protein [Klebsormidium nitens]